MSYEEIKIKDFIIEVDINDYIQGNYDINVWKNNGQYHHNSQFLYTIPNINVRIVDGVIEDLKEWLLIYEHEPKFIKELFKDQVNRIKDNYNIVMNGNSAIVNDEYIIEYDDILNVINVYKNKIILYSLYGGKL